LIKAAASVGFARAADVYEAARPSYPPEVVALVDDGARVVVDLAAGTGKLTRLLVRDGRFVLGVEPVDAMRRLCAAHAPVTGGTAERLPLRSRSADAVTVGQGFHWFSHDAALREIARVLRPGGLLLLVWNERDTTAPWVEAMSRITHAHDPGDATAYVKLDDWAPVIDACGLFGPVTKQAFPFTHPATKQTFVERALSVSYIASASDEVRAQVARDIAAAVDHLDEPFDFPHVAETYTCRKR
jgi:SAM-dependent methyltransferase